MTTSALPRIIQGGMGIGVSGYPLARAAARAGALGVVSGTAIDTVMVRRLQLGDADGDVRRALSHFPFPRVAERIVAEFFVPGGKPAGAPFRLVPLPAVKPSRRQLELVVAANFVEIFLAKEGHDGPIGVNYLEKIQLPTLPSLLGALLAGVDVVLMGAGIPSQVPGILDRLSAWEDAELRLSVTDNASPEPVVQRFSPREVFGERPAPLARPAFLAIVSSHVIAKVLTKKASGSIQGFVIEDHTAGGHNAPPRKKTAPPEFGPADAPDLAAFRALGSPFWLAGRCGSAEGLRRALDAGAYGVQVGTPFAYCEESGVTDDIKRDVVARARSQRVRVLTDFEASPTGYPFKIVVRDDAERELAALRARERVCDLGYLRETAMVGGAIVYRCPSEPPKNYAHKGGAASETENKLCLCNQLLATVGLGMPREGGGELPLLTAGEELAAIGQFLAPGASSYTAADVVRVLQS